MAPSCEALPQVSVREDKHGGGEEKKLFRFLKNRSAEFILTHNVLTFASDFAALGS